MSKQNIINSLSFEKRQLQLYIEQKEKLAEKYNTLRDFSSQCKSHIKSFGNSISNRKKRLSKVDELLRTVKTASKYKNKMNSMLKGSDYSSATKNISQLESTISIQMKKIVSDIEYVDRKITYIKNRIERMQYELYTYDEEVGKNAKQ